MESQTLLTDLYELTMAYGYWKKGMAHKEGVFHHFFRKRPFNGTFAIAAGLQTFLEFLSHFRYQESDLAYLETLRGEDGKPLFEPAFLEYLSQMRFTCDIDAVLEGTPVFPHEPLVRVQGPLLQAQLLESPILNIMNFQTLIATKAARVCYAARPDQVIEFGLRRAQGIDGALSASRAAYIGGCHGTSNLLAGKLYGIPVKGTHAHSWVMAFKEEEEAFEAWADVMPGNFFLLVDTYDSLLGVKKAVSLAKSLQKQGRGVLRGVRLDSGDLAHLSIEIRKILDEAGFPQAKIMASNELDEYIINDLKHQGAKINIWGVGTNLVTGKDQPALDGVYKLSALRDHASAPWQYKIKISEQLVKVTTPGILQVRRWENNQVYMADMIYDLLAPPQDVSVVIDPFDPTHSKKIGSKELYEDLLRPVMRKGKLIYDFPTLDQVREKTLTDLNKFHPAIRRFLYPQPYFTGLEESLKNLKLKMIEEGKG